MPIAYLKLELRIEGAHSLKDKRQVVRSVKDRLRNSFNISIAEIEVTDMWQLATLGVVSISGSRDYLEGLMQNVERPPCAWPITLARRWWTRFGIIWKADVSCGIGHIASVSDQCYP